MFVGCRVHKGSQLKKNRQRFIIKLQINIQFKEYFQANGFSTSKIKNEILLSFTNLLMLIEFNSI